MGTSRSLILLNGVVLTMDPARPRAAAIGLRDGRVVAVGEAAEVRAAVPGAEEIDLRGRAAVPGFIDAHLHLLSYGHSLRQVNLAGVTTIAEAVERARTMATRLPVADWVLGAGWRRNDLADGRLPVAADLDAVLPDRPVALQSHDLHSVWCNARALALAGITAETADPAGGKLERDAAGQPTGVLYENAQALIWQHVPVPDAAQDDAALREGLRALAAHGITSVGNMEGRAALAAVQRARAAGDLTLRVYQTIPTADLEAAIALGIRSGLGDEWLRLGHVKIFADGALGSRTAWMCAPYEGDASNTGVPIHRPEGLRALVERAARAGIASAIHAIGDRANAVVLDIFEAGRREGWLPAAPRPRIEHVQVLQPGDLSRLAQLDIVASMQPIHCTADMAAVDQHWGERGRYAYAFRTLREHGTILAFGSDAPVEEPDVIAGLHAAVTRQHPDGSPAGGWYPAERLSVEEALWAYTQGAAYASGEEAIKGSLAPGKLGDVTVLSANPMMLSGAELLDLRVAMTVVGGQVVYGQEGLL